MLNRVGRIGRASLCAALGMTACNAGPGPQASVLKACEGREGRCGSLAVPADPSLPEGDQLQLALRVLPSRAEPAAADPVYLLVGGPGQAATEVGPLLRPVLNELRAEREIVLIDQRGTGSSAPLDCELPNEKLADAFRADLPLAHLRTCLEGYPTDPALYITERAVEDLESVRVHLGHEQINLFGLSYGTRLALSYMRRHPARVRAAVLDGVAPPNITLPTQMDLGMRRALELNLAACEGDANCAAAFPRLGARLLAWVRSLDESPWTGELEHPRTGQPERVSIDANAATGIVRSALYAPAVASLLPLALDAAIEGDPRVLVALSAVGEATADTLSLGLFLSVVCSEDMARVEHEPVADAQDPAAQIFGGRMYAPLVQACAGWPKGTPPEDHAKPVGVATQTLLLSGELDPATPVAWGAMAAEQLPNSTHIVVPGTGHGTWAAPCVGKLISNFVAQGDAAGLDRGCVEGIVPPRFFHSPAGPRMGPPASERGEQP